MTKNIVNYTAMNDYIFKEVFNKKNILVEYLNIICDLNLKEEDIEYEPVELKDGIHAKGSRFDIRVKAINTRIDLESQNAKLGGSDEYQDNRKIHYASQLHSTSYDEGQRYYKKMRTIIIFILNYKLPGNDYIQHTKYKNLTTNVEYDNIDIIEISLKNIKKNDTIKERMLSVLGSNNLENYVNEAGIIKEVINVIKGINDDERKIAQARYAEDLERMWHTEREIAIEEGRAEGRAQGLYEGRLEGLAEGKAQGLVEGKELGLAEGKSQGLAEGHEKALKEMIIKMNLNSLDTSTISKITGLEVEKVESILKEQK